MIPGQVLLCTLHIERVSYDWRSTIIGIASPLSCFPKMLVDMYAEIKGFSLRFQWFAGFSGEPLEPPLEYPPRLYRCDVVKKKNLACGEREKKNFVTDHKFFSCLHEGEVH